MSDKGERSHIIIGIKDLGRNFRCQFCKLAMSRCHECWRDGWLSPTTDHPPPNNEPLEKSEAGTYLNTLLKRLKWLLVSPTWPILFVCISRPYFLLWERVDFFCKRWRHNSKVWEPDQEKPVWPVKVGGGLRNESWWIVFGKGGWMWQAFTLLKEKTRCVVSVIYSYLWRLRNWMKWFYWNWESITQEMFNSIQAHHLLTSKIFLYCVEAVNLDSAKTSAVWKLPQNKKNRLIFDQELIPPPVSTTPN